MTPSKLPMAIALIAVGGCATNPVTGKRELALISEQQEVQIGKQAAEEATQQMGLVHDAALQQYVSSIGMVLAKHSERPELPWEFHVIDDPTPNAFALPGGPVFVTRGLVTLMNSEAQLATVVGHEIGHVTARHSVNQMSKQQLAQLGLGLGAVLVPGGDQLAGLASEGLGLLFLKYGRDDERQADELGFRYALNDGYDVREMGKVFLSLERSSQLEGAPEDTELGRDPPGGAGADRERREARRRARRELQARARRRPGVPATRERPRIRREPAQRLLPRGHVLPP